MVLDQIGAAGLQGVEHRLVEGRHVDLGVLGHVQVVVVQGGPEQVDLLRQAEASQRRHVHGHVAAARLVQHLPGVVDIGLAPGRGLQRIDLALRPHHVAEHAGVVAAARQVLADLLAGMHAREGQHDVGLADRVVLAVVGRPRRIGDRLLDIGGGGVGGGRRGDGERRQGGDAEQRAKAFHHLSEDAIFTLAAWSGPDR